MSNVLSQDEVDSLLKGVSSGEIEIETDSPRADQGAVAYDFTRQEPTLRGQVPTLDMANNRFANVFRATLSKMVRREIDIVAEPTDMIKFADFHGSLPVPTSLHIFRIEGLVGKALLVFDTPLVFSLIECYFGGKATEEMKIEGREFTAIENRIMRKVVSASLEDLAAAWDRIHKVKMTYIRSEINPQFATIALPGDLAIVIRFKLDMMEGIGGLMTVCIPYSTIEPIRSKLQATMEGDQPKVGAGWKKSLQERIQETKMEMVVELGIAQMTAERLLRLTVGDVIQLEQDVTQELVAKVEGLPKFKGRPGVVRGNQAIKIGQRCIRMTGT
jgi:flagellar motor switch protein FliM